MKFTPPTSEQFHEICLNLLSLGWVLVGSRDLQEMKFAKGNKIYDLSAADLTKLKEIEEKGLFVIG